VTNICTVTQTRNLTAKVLAALPIELFRALGDPNRVALVAWLARQREAKTVSEIVDSGCCAVDFSVISRHLHTLRDAGAVEAEKSGREVRYRLGAAALAQTLRNIADLLDRCCKE
jgi:DNA-binding transcriptional ArsR family regulator